MGIDISRHVFGPEETPEEIFWRCVEEDRRKGAFRCYNIEFYRKGFGKKGEEANCHPCLYLGEDKLIPYCQIRFHRIPLAKPHPNCPYLTFFEVEDKEIEAFGCIDVKLLVSLLNLAS